MSQKVNCCRNLQQIGNKVHCCWCGRLCGRCMVDFVAGFGNNLNLMAFHGGLCCQYSQLCCWYGQLCCQCVLHQSNIVDRVEFSFVASVYWDLPAASVVTDASESRRSSMLMLTIWPATSQLLHAYILVFKCVNFQLYPSRFYTSSYSKKSVDNNKSLSVDNFSISQLISRSFTPSQS